MKDSFEILAVVLEAHRLPYVKPLLNDLMDYHHQTYLHCVHTAILAVQIGEEYGMDDTALLSVAAGALLHDAGKLDMPLEILDNTNRLSDKEMAVIKTHPICSYKRLQALGIEHPSIVDDICLKHHLYRNGTGYPSKDTFPLAHKHLVLPDEVSIITIADIFSAIVSPRPYHSCLTAIFALGKLYSGVAEGKYPEKFVRIMDSLVIHNRLILSTGGDTYGKRLSP